MVDFSEVPLGKSNTGGAVVFGGDGLGGLHWLQKIDALKARQAERDKAAAERAQAASLKDFSSKLNFKTGEGGLTYQPLLQKGNEEAYAKLLALQQDKTLDPQEKMVQQQLIINQRQRVIETSKQIDKHLGDLVDKASQDKRIDREKAIGLFHATQYDENHQLIDPLKYDPRTAQQALDSPEALNHQEVWKQFAKDAVQKDSEAYERAARPGGTGLKTYWEGSQTVERDPVTHQQVLDPKTGDAVLRITPGTVLAARNDPFASRILDHIRTQREQLEQSAVQKMQNNLPLTDAERTHVEQRQQGALPTIEQDLAQQLVPYAYSRTKHEETFRPAPQPRAVRAAAGPKYTLTGGTDYAPEVIGGTGVGGTQGLTSLAASEPLKRVGKDGVAHDFEAEGLHPQSIVLHNGQPAKMVSNNATSQKLRYIKPQLYLTSSSGNVLTPKDPALLAAYQRGDRQPLLDWARQEREKDPKVKFEWHFLAAPAQGAKLTTEGSNTEAIFQRLRAAGSDKPDDVLHATAQKLAEQESASLLLPYKGSDKRQIDGATHYMLRDPKRQQQMQRELDYFTNNTVPRPLEARAVKKKSIGVDFGTTPQPPASTSSAAPAESIKRAGTKKTGISF